MNLILIVIYTNLMISSRGIQLIMLIKIPRNAKLNCFNSVLQLNKNSYDKTIISLTIIVLQNFSRYKNKCVWYEKRIRIVSSKYLLAFIMFYRKWFMLSTRLRKKLICSFWSEVFCFINQLYMYNITFYRLRLFNLVE